MKSGVIIFKGPKIFSASEYRKHVIETEVNPVLERNGFKPATSTIEAFKMLQNCEELYNSLDDSKKLKTVFQCLNNAFCEFYDMEIFSAIPQAPNFTEYELFGVFQPLVKW